MRSRTLPDCLTAPLKADAGATIEAAIKLIVDEMKAIHGGDWTTLVDHQAHLVMITAVSANKKGRINV